MLMIGVEGFGELVGLQEAVGQEEELVGAQVLVHPLVLLLLTAIRQIVRGTTLSENKSHHITQDDY